MDYGFNQERRILILKLIKKISKKYIAVTLIFMGVISYYQHLQNMSITYAEQKFDEYHLKRVKQDKIHIHKGYFYQNYNDKFSRMNIFYNIKHPIKHNRKIHKINKVKQNRTSNIHTETNIQQNNSNNDQSSEPQGSVNNSEISESNNSLNNEQNNEDSTSDINNSAANEIAQAESSNSYNAQNGRYYGKYQLDISYLNGDLSPANQDKTFINYVNERYGSMENALAFRKVHNWY